MLPLHPHAGRNQFSKLYGQSLLKKLEEHNTNRVVFNKLAVRYVLSWDNGNSMTAEEQLERIKRENPPI
jgi:hypothetical protein